MKIIATKNDPYFNFSTTILENRVERSNIYKKINGELIKTNIKPFMSTYPEFIDIYMPGMSIRNVRKIFKEVDNKVVGIRLAFESPFKNFTKAVKEFKKINCYFKYLLAFNGTKFITEFKTDTSGIIVENAYNLTVFNNSFNREAGKFYCHLEQRDNKILMKPRNNLDYVAYNKGGENWLRDMWLSESMDKYRDKVMKND